MKLFCKHEWKKISESTTQSKFEHSISVSQSVSQGVKSLPHQLVCAERKFIQVFSCEKCGKIKRFIEKI